MKRTCWLLPLVALIAVLAPARADACTCVVGAPVCDTFWKTDVVFAGEVLEIAPIPNPSGRQFMAHKRVRFRVDQSWRGAVEGTVEITTGAGGGDCGYGFEKGERYLVYASARDGGLSTSICSRTRPLARASDDLDYLKTALRPSATGRVFGVVRYHQDRGPRAPDRFAAGYTVRLSAGDRRWTATTGPDGRYEFTGVAAGEYSIALETTATEHADGPRTVTLADPRGCAAADFYVVPDGRIAVRLVDGAGQPRPRLRVELLDLDALPADRPAFSQDTRETDADGRVEFARLHPKRYVLAVNATRPPSVVQPFGMTFFPGAASVDAAREIPLGVGERLDLGDWPLEGALAERRIEGRVVWQDGRPAAGAHVILFGSRDGPWANRSVDRGSATADADGRFAFTAYEGIAYTLLAYVNVGDPVVQWSSPRVEVVAGASADGMVLTLRAPARR